MDREIAEFASVLLIRLQAFLLLLITSSFFNQVYARDHRICVETGLVAESGISVMRGAERRRRTHEVKVIMPNTDLKTRKEVV